MFDLRDIMGDRGLVTLCGVPEGLDGLIAGDFVKALAGIGRRGLGVHVARDDQRMATMADALAFFAPDIEVLRFPAWDCIPYDRVSPRADILAERMATLARLAAPAQGPLPPRLVLTTVNAALQRVVAPDVIAGASWSARPGNRIAMDTLTDYLSRNGFNRTGTVVEPGDFAIRGGIVDIFAPGSAESVRLDLFGDTLESIRSFDPQTQRTTGQLQAIELLPASEILLSEGSVRLFRAQYVAAFGTVTEADPLYESISQGRHFQGMEHWLPMFHQDLATLFDYIGDAPVLLDHLADDARHSRLEQIEEYYQSRKAALAQSGFGAPPYKPVAPETLFLSEDDWSAALKHRMVRVLTPFDVPDGGSTGRVVAVGGRQGRSFAAERAEEGRNVFDALRDHVAALKTRRKQVVIASWSAGSRDRMAGVLADHDVGPMAVVEDWPGANGLPAGTTALAVLGIEAGFETDDLAVIGEQDVLGDRLVRRAAKLPAPRTSSPRPRACRPAIS